MSNFNQRVFEIVRRIPAGTVVSYGQIARLAGYPHASRQVGYAMHQIKDEDNLPWYRVVFKDGGMAFAETGQKALLENEGVKFSADGKVDMAKYNWDATEIEAEIDLQK